MDWALTLGTTLPHHDPGRPARRATVGSYFVAVALLVASGVLAIARPAPDWSTAGVLVDTDSGATYANRNGVLHPALNLASAMLASDGTHPATTRTVSAADIDRAPRGPLLGIAGAPAALPHQDRLFTGGWSVCDVRAATGDPVTTTAVLGSAPPGSPLSVAEAVLVVDEGDPRTDAAHLLWAGRRLPVDLTDRALVQALGLLGSTPRPVSSLLLDTLPPTPPVGVVQPAGAGRPGTVDVSDGGGRRVTVGTVLRSAHADGRLAFHLVHRDGIETVSPVVADLLMSRTGAGLVDLPPSRLAGLPQTSEVPVAPRDLPVAAPRLTAGAAPLICVTWQSAAVGWAVTAGHPSASGASAGTIPAAGGPLDQVQITPGTGAVVRAGENRGTRPADAPEATEAQAYLVTDFGVAYPVDDDVPERLGLADAGATLPVAPATILGSLPRGPALSTRDAGRAWGFGSDAADDCTRRLTGITC